MQGQPPLSATTDVLIDVLDADDQNPLFDAGDGYDARLPQPARKVRFQLVAFFFFSVLPGFQIGTDRRFIFWFLFFCFRAQFWRCDRGH